MYNLVECSDIYLKPSGSLWQYFRDKPAWDNNNSTIDFPANNINNDNSNKNDNINLKNNNTTQAETNI